MNITETLINTTKTLLGNKSVQQILRYLATSTISYFADKYGITLFKYDINDSRNMIYQHNMNGGKLDPQLSEEVVNLYRMQRFMDEYNKLEEVPQINVNDYLNKLFGMTKIDEVVKVQNAFNNDENLLNFDLDTLETSAIVDSYEINSGGLYVPNRDIILQTNEGQNIADIKNDYLDKRQDIKNDKELYKLLEEYHAKMKTKEVTDYFKGVM